jgi:outer membrane protein TolC
MFHRIRLAPTRETTFDGVDDAGRRPAPASRCAAGIVVVIVAAWPGIASPQQAPSAAGTVVVRQTTAPGAGVLVINPSILTQGTTSGSVSGGALPGGGTLTLREAVRLGLEFNLSSVTATYNVRQAQARETLARTPLMPHLVGQVSDSEQKINLGALGVRFDTPVPGFTLPETVGPYNVLDFRLRVSQTLFDAPARAQLRAARARSSGMEFSARDSQDVVVLAVAGTYLQATATRDRVAASRAQVETAEALFRRATEQRDAGLATPVDVNRAQVQVLAQRQRVSALSAELAKQKIDLARLIGVSTATVFELGEPLAFSVLAAPGLEEALAQAAQRAEIKAAEAEVRAAEQLLAAARAQRIPTAGVTADVGVNKSNPTPAQVTYSLAAVVRIPVWEGGRVGGETRLAEATLALRQAELDNLRGNVEAEVRRVFLDLTAAAEQVEVAQANLRVTTENLTLTRQRFDAGLGDNLSVVLAQESVAVAEQARITAVHAHNLGRLLLARLIGRAATEYTAFLNLP